MAASSVTPARRAGHRVAGTPRTHRQVTVTVPAEILDDIQERVGSDNVSSYIVETLTDSERRLALREFLDMADDEHGPVTPEELAQARRIWGDALEGT